MKFFALFAALFLACSAASAQDTLQPAAYKTVIGKKNEFRRIRLSGFFTALNELALPSQNQVGLAYSSGGEACLLFNQRFYFGGFGIASVAPNDLDRTLDGIDMRSLRFGASTGFKIAPNKPLHLNIGARIGYAGLLWHENIRNDFDDHGRLVKRLDGWSVAPHINLEANFFSWLQAYAGVGYNFAWGESDGVYDVARDLRQASFQIGVSFGYFK